MERALTWVLLIGGTVLLALGFHHHSPVCATLGYVGVVIGAFALGDKS